MSDFVFLIAIFAVFWFLLIRPQQKRAKEHKTMVEALSKGDEAVTNGGLLGKITKVGDSFVTLEIADGLRVQVQRASVATLMPKGTMILTPYPARKAPVSRQLEMGFKS